MGLFAVPFAGNMFSYVLADLEYQQSIGTTALEYGRTLSHIFGWNYALDRTEANVVNLDATLSRRRTDREVNDIDPDPQHIAVLRVGGNWMHKFVMSDAPGNVTPDVGISRGLPMLEADHDADDITRDDANSQFTKFDATATFTLPLPKVGSTAFAYRGTVGGQFTNVALYGSEQLYLGGMDTIRGLRSGEIVGDRGFYSRNEIAWVNTPTWHDGRIEPYVFLDVGKASLVAVSSFPTLAPIGAGLRAQWQSCQRMISGELTVGRALTQPASLGPRVTLVLRAANINFVKKYKRNSHVVYDHRDPRAMRYCLYLGRMEHGHADSDACCRHSCSVGRQHTPCRYGRHHQRRGNPAGTARQRSARFAIARYTATALGAQTATDCGRAVPPGGRERAL